VTRSARAATAEKLAAINRPDDVVDDDDDDAFEITKKFAESLSLSLSLSLSFSMNLLQQAVC
jgi:hypothetical protein